MDRPRRNLPKRPRTGDGDGLRRSKARAHKSDSDSYSDSGSGSSSGSSTVVGAAGGRPTRRPSKGKQKAAVSAPEAPRHSRQPPARETATLSPGATRTGAYHPIWSHDGSLIADPAAQVAALNGGFCELLACLRGVDANLDKIMRCLGVQCAGAMEDKVAAILTHVERGGRGAE